MASTGVMLVLTAALAVLVVADPEPVQDFCVAVHPAGDAAAYPGFPCKPASAVVSDDFFFAGLAVAGDTSNRFGFNVTQGNVEAFPGVNTLGLSINRGDFAPGGVNPPHSHPRATELVHVIAGRVLVGFVSTAGRLYSKVLREGESFVFPRGMIHFQYNVGEASAARVITVFNSQLPGVVGAGPALFGADPEIPDVVLAKSFQVDAKIIKLLKSMFKN
ncbi:germin-like protein 3-8 [Oryza brachyantha]|uniref:Germin-like protein n=1 Tax=Oryza brachyantha TaxID=4533 RepID=J3LTW1_ORYBR|nr:germin-like protein 3-8 [Oryza brachyantha]